MNIVELNDKELSLAQGGYSSTTNEDGTITLTVALTESYQQIFTDFGIRESDFQAKTAPFVPDIVAGKYHGCTLTLTKRPKPHWGNEIIAVSFF